MPTTKVLLAVNAGSSSVKASVYHARPESFATESSSTTSPQLLAEAQVSGLTAPPALLTYSRGGAVVCKNKEVQDRLSSLSSSSSTSSTSSSVTQELAFRILLETLVHDSGLTSISSLRDIAIVAHRIVHGGHYHCEQVITNDTYHHLEELTDLAPLHNSPALAIVRSCISQLPSAANVACFDSQFHATIPPHIHTYPIDPVIARKNGLRKYGFHGLSYSFVVRSVAAYLGKPRNQLSLIALHLGSGASACAVANGQSRDTSMGLTPLAGLPGATRSGSVDPSLVFHYASNVGKLSPSSTQDLHISVAEEILNKQSGWKALTGTTDFATIIARRSDPRSSNDKYRLAIDLFVDRIAGFVGSYYVTLGGAVDALVFAGGIGERSAELRRAVMDRVQCLGFSLDETRNGSGGSGGSGPVWDIGDTTARLRTLVCKTDEQWEMAKICMQNEALWA